MKAQTIGCSMYGIAAFLMLPLIAHADILQLSVSPDITAAPGTTGNGFDVLLTNLSGPAVSIAAFSFEISVLSPDITFTDASTATMSPYIFDGNSLFGPNITESNTLQTLDASDLYAGAGDVVLGTGATLALGRIGFDVSSTAPVESVDLVFTGYPATSLSDSQSNNIPITSLTGGSVDVLSATATVPEPSSPVLLLMIAALILWRWRRRKHLCHRQAA